MSTNAARGSVGATEVKGVGGTVRAPQVEGVGRMVRAVQDEGVGGPVRTAQDEGVGRIVRTSQDEGVGGTVRTTQADLVEREAVGQGEYRVTIAANDRVRQSPDLDLSGMSTENYFRNPVVMWAHDLTGRSPSGGLPIGRTLSLEWRPGRGLAARFEFLDGDPFARRVRNAWDKGFLRAASISWAPLESERLGDGSRRDVRSELLEWSIVPVPADPGALRESHRLMIDAFLSDGRSGVTEPPPPPGERADLREALSLVSGFAQEMRRGFPRLRE